MSRIFLYALALISISTALTSLALATPSRVIIIRHAEKPDDDNNPNLSEAGQKRAAALVSFFASNAVVQEKGEPQIIIGKSPSHDGAALRSEQTIQPLAESLNIKPIFDYSTPDVRKMADALLKNSEFDGKVVLLCWNHTDIPEIALDLGATTAPSKWKAKVFDRVWVLDFNGSELSSFRDLPQHLMPGDSAN